MKLTADEGVDRAIVERLRADGHDVFYVAESVAGINDEEVLHAANERRAVRVTSDKDFGELVFRQKRMAHGVILLRLAGLAPDTKASIVAGALREHESEMQGSFSVVMPSSVRIRHRDRGEKQDTTSDKW